MNHDLIQTNYTANVITNYPYVRVIPGLLFIAGVQLRLLKYIQRFFLRNIILWFNSFCAIVREDFILGDGLKHAGFSLKTSYFFDTLIFTYISTYCLADLLIYC